MRRARRIDPLAVVGLLIGVCVVGAVVLLGADERVRQAGEPGLLERWLIGQSAMPVQCGVDDNHRALYFGGIAPH